MYVFKKSKQFWIFCFIFHWKANISINNFKSICFSWKGFPSHLPRSLAERNFTDFTLVSDEQIQIPAHKIVLSASSQVLKNILLNNQHSHPLKYLKGFKKKEFTVYLPRGRNYWPRQYKWVQGQGKGFRSERYCTWSRSRFRVETMVQSFLRVKILILF